MTAKRTSKPSTAGGSTRRPEVPPPEAPDPASARSRRAALDGEADAARETASRDARTSAQADPRIVDDEEVQHGQSPRNRGREAEPMLSSGRHRPRIAPEEIDDETLDLGNDTDVRGGPRRDHSGHDDT